MDRRRHLLIGSALLASATAHAQPDPFAETGSGSASAGSNVANTPPAADAAPAAGCEFLTQETCIKSNTTQYLTSGAYVFASVLVFSIVRMWWNKRGTSTIAVRLLVTLFAAAGFAGALVGLDVARGKDVSCCMASSVFRGEMFLADSTPARVAVLGIVPAVVLFLLVTFVEGLVRGRK